jgi:hypothetical protein
MKTQMPTDSFEPTQEGYARAAEWLVATLSETFNPENQQAKSARLRYVFACVQLAQFLAVLGKADASISFSILAEALGDLDSGVVNPLLAPVDAARPGRRSDDSMQWRLRAEVCAGMQYIVASGVDEPEVIAETAARYRNGLMRLRRAGASDLDKSLRSWCTSFSNSTVANEHATRMYGFHIRAISTAKKIGTPQDNFRMIGGEMIARATDAALRRP